MIMNRTITIISLVGGLIAIFLSFILGSSLFALISAILFAFSFIIWKYGYLIIPYITKATNIIEVRGNYIVPPTRDYILKKTNNGWYATRYLEIIFYESSIDKNKEGRTNLFESFEKTLASIKHNVKISYLISPIDMSKYIDEIKTKRSEAEAKKARLKPNDPEYIKIEREISMWNNQLEKIAYGEKPMEIVAYVSTTSFSPTKEEAVALSKRRASEIKTIISSVLAADVRELKDLDMLKCFEWDYFIPETHDEFEDEVF